MELTKEKAHKLCRAMWLEIARKELTNKSESKVLQWYNSKYKTYIDSECFACGYYYKINDGVNCPLSYCKNEPCGDSCCYYGPFSDWQEEFDPKYARLIADLFID